MNLQYLATQTQQQVLSQRQIESLDILAMDIQELREFLIGEQEENPLLSFVGGEHSRFAGHDIEQDVLQNIPAPREESVSTFLLSQLCLENCTDAAVEAFHVLTESVDENGFLRTSPAELSLMFQIPVPQLEKCLQVLQNLEPAGVCAASLEECLTLQLKAAHYDDELLFVVVAHHLADVAGGRINHIARALKTDASRISECVRVIKTLNPRPLNGLVGRATQYAVPDILLSRDNEEWHVDLNDGFIDRLEISGYYEDLACRTADAELREYLHGKIRRARFLSAVLQRRRETLIRIGYCLALRQSDFLLSRGALMPLSMTQVANGLGIHLSTLSRAVRGKYLQYPGGVCELRALFPRGGSAGDADSGREGIKGHLRKLIGEEDRTRPYSDLQLTSLLKERGISVSRRTVAACRGELHIGGMHDRRATS